MSIGGSQARLVERGLRKHFQPSACMYLCMLQDTHSLAVPLVPFILQCMSSSLEDADTVDGALAERCPKLTAAWCDAFADSSLSDTV